MGEEEYVTGITSMEDAVMTFGATTGKNKFQDIWVHLVDYDVRHHSRHRRPLEWVWVADREAGPINPQGGQEERVEL